jgi:hypothetical protein
MRSGSTIREIQVQRHQHAIFRAATLGKHRIAGTRKSLAGDHMRFETCPAKDRGVFCWKILVDFELQALISSGNAIVPSRVNSARVRQCRIDIGVRQCWVAPQYLFARYTCCNVVHYDGHQDTRSADTRSTVADGQVYADSLAPILHRSI